MPFLFQALTREIWPLKTDFAIRLAVRLAGSGLFCPMFGRLLEFSA